MLERGLKQLVGVVHFGFPSLPPGAEAPVMMPSSMNLLCFSVLWCMVQHALIDGGRCVGCRHRVTTRVFLPALIACKLPVQSQPLGLQVGLHPLGMCLKAKGQAANDTGPGSVIALSLKKACNAMLTANCPERFCELPGMGTLLWELTAENYFECKIGACVYPGNGFCVNVYQFMNR